MRKKGEPVDYCLRIHYNKMFWIVYIFVLSGLRDAVGLSQQITVCWCLKLFNSTCTLSNIIFIVAASVFSEALMPEFLLAVADLNSRLCGCTTPIEWGVVWGTEQAALAQAVLCQPCGSQHTGLEYNCTPDM